MGFFIGWNRSGGNVDDRRRFLLAVTGASGAPFAAALLGRMVLEPAVGQVALLASSAGRRCLMDEAGTDPEGLADRANGQCGAGRVLLLDENDMGSEFSSGSALHGGMAVVPCSAGTLGRIASGTSDNLIARAADVCLKERRPLVLCVRETPLARVHIENMLRAHDAGAVIMPLSPTFYHRPGSIGDICDAFATRVMDLLGLHQEDGRRWRGGGL
jgi:4-hydroxy-3-polyprenylbenzoate decarboxylase